MSVQCLWPTSATHHSTNESILIIALVWLDQSFMWNVNVSFYTGVTVIQGYEDDIELFFSFRYFHYHIIMTFKNHVGSFFYLIQTFEQSTMNFSWRVQLTSIYHYSDYFMWTGKYIIAEFTETAHFTFKMSECIREFRVTRKILTPVHKKLAFAVHSKEIGPKGRGDKDSCVIRDNINLVLKKG